MIDEKRKREFIDLLWHYLEEPFGKCHSGIIFQNDQEKDYIESMLNKFTNLKIETTIDEHPGKRVNMIQFSLSLEEEIT